MSLPRPGDIRGAEPGDRGPGRPPADANSVFGPWSPWCAKLKYKIGRFQVAAVGLRGRMGADLS